jgi:hypothetical protein
MTSRVRFKFQTASGYASAISRRIAPEACVDFDPLENRGRRESRAPIAPAVVRTKSARVDHRFNRITPAFPARMVYGLLRALPGDRLVCHRRLADDRCISNPVGRMHLSQNLTPASGRRNHTTSPSAPVFTECFAGLVPPGKVRRRRFAAPFVRAPADRSREHPPCDPIARPTLSRPSHPTARS